jgi:hypothetical protein
MVRGRPVNTASWAWQQLTVGKKATVDCASADCASADCASADCASADCASADCHDCASAAEVYVENLSLQPVWFDPSWNRIWK